MTVSAKGGINLGGMMDNSAVFIFFILLLPGDLIAVHVDASQ